MPDNAADYAYDPGFGDDGPTVQTNTNYNNQGAAEGRTVAVYGDFYITGEDDSLSVFEELLEMV